MVGVGFFEEFAEHGALVKRFALILKSRHQAARVQVQQGLRLVVGVHFDVLVWDAFLFERDPYSLYEGTEPAGIQLEVVLCGVRLEYISLLC